MSNEQFWRWYESVAAERLALRETTFRMIFSHLDRIVGARPITIVETGCVRLAGNWEGDGQSTVLFDKYLEGALPGSRGVSIDLDPKATQTCRSIVSDRIDVRTGDSVRELRVLAQELRGQGRMIDLLYLDSYDVDWANPVPSAVHHLKELVSIITCVSPQTLLVVDDAPSECRVVPAGGKRVALISRQVIGGKGKFVAEYAEQVGARPHFAHYQVGWTGLV